MSMKRRLDALESAHAPNPFDAGELMMIIDLQPGGHSLFHAVDQHGNRHSIDDDLRRAWDRSTVRKDIVLQITKHEPNPQHATNFTQKVAEEVAQ